jgi:signal transduction histidine kinase
MEVRDLESLVVPPEPSTGDSDTSAAPVEHDAILLVDIGGRVQHATPGAGRLFGYDPGRLWGVPVEMLLVSPGDWTVPTEGGQYPVATVATGRRRDGTEIALRVDIAAVDGPDGGRHASLRLAEAGGEHAPEPRRTAALADLASRLSAAALPDEIADIVVDHARSALGATVVELVLLEGSRPRLVRLVGYDDATVARIDGRVLVEQGAIGDSLRTGRPIVLATAAERHARYPGIRRWLGEARPRALVCLPLIADRQTTGALALGFDEDRASTDEDLSHMQVVAHATAQALHRARLFDKAALAAAEATSLARLGGALARADTARAASAALLDGIAATARPSTMSVALLDEAREEFELIEVRSTGRDVAARPRWSLRLPSPARDVVRSGTAVSLDKAEYRRRYPEVSAISDPTALGRYLALPLVVAGRPMGAVGLSFGIGQDDDPPVAHLQALVDSAAQAIARARLSDAERAARRLLGAVIDQMPLGVLVLDAGSRDPLYANETYRQLLSPADGGSRVLRLDGTPWPDEELPSARALELGEVVTDELCIVERADGSRSTITMSAGPVRSGSGAVIAGVAVYADVTARREAELARDAFIGILSHELRTPITSIFAGAVLLARGVDESTARDVADGMLDDAVRLRAIVEDVLVLSRVEHGADLARDDAVLVHRVAARVVADEERRWPGRTFELDMAADVPPAVGDEGYIEHVLRNLLSNAGKYGPPDGRIRVVVETGEADVRVRVLDEGPGIPPGDEERVFQLFYRSDDTARRAPGAGIGLYAVRALVDGMGGRVWARRRPEGGAEVGFSLRRLAVDRVV